MRFKRCFFWLAAVLLVVVGSAWAQGLEPMAARLLAEANASREAAGVAPLRWDGTLAHAAKLHCQRMAAEGPIAHQYPGEPDVAERSAAVGARFSLIEENVAVASEVGDLHPGWMNSPGHRRNLLNPEVNAVGIAVVETRGLFYAVADYSRQVADLQPQEVEAAFAQRLRERGLAILRDPRPARAICLAGPSAKAGDLQPQPGMTMHWQGADPSQLPENLAGALKSGRFHKAAVGACPAEAASGGFSQFRLAVLLYE